MTDESVFHSGTQAERPHIADIFSLMTIITTLYVPGVHGALRIFIQQKLEIQNLYLPLQLATIKNNLGHYPGLSGIITNIFQSLPDSITTIKNLEPMKQKILLFPAMAMLTYGSALADDGLQMNVTPNEGTPRTVTVISGDILTFSNTEMKLMNGDVEKASFALPKIQTISFKTPGSVDILTEDAIRPLHNPVGDMLEIVCPPEQQRMLCVRDMSGTLMLRVNNWKGEPVDVSSLGAGIYLVTVNNSTFKILKK